MVEHFKGALFLIQVEDALLSDNYIDIACMVSTSMSESTEEIDVSAKCNSPYKHLMEGGTQSMSLSMNGPFNNDESMGIMMEASNAGSILNYKITSGAGDLYAGAFLITSCERSGDNNAAEQYSLSLSSAGAIAYTPVTPPAP